MIDCPFARFIPVVQRIAEPQVCDALRGNRQGAREIADRTEGRARQVIEFEDTTLAKAVERMTTEESEAYALRTENAKTGM